MRDSVWAKYAMHVTRIYRSLESRRNENKRVPWGGGGREEAGESPFEVRI